MNEIMEIEIGNHLTPYTKLVRLSDWMTCKVIEISDKPYFLVMDISGDKDTDLIIYYGSCLYGDLYIGSRRLELYLYEGL